MAFVKVTVDVHCDYENIVYRAFIGGELFSERLWRWPNRYLEETFQIEASPGQYEIHYTSVDSSASIHAMNPRVIFGDAVANGNIITIF